MSATNARLSASSVSRENGEAESTGRPSARSINLSFEGSWRIHRGV